MILSDDEDATKCNNSNLPESPQHKKIRIVEYHSIAESSEKRSPSIDLDDSNDAKKDLDYLKTESSKASSTSIDLDNSNDTTNDLDYLKNSDLKLQSNPCLLDMPTSTSKLNETKENNNPINQTERFVIDTPTSTSRLNEIDTKSILSKQEMIFQFLRQFQASFASVPKYLKCILCNNIVVNAYCGYCECIYCETCMLQYFQTNSHCPGNSANCMETNLKNGMITLDFKMNSKVADLKIMCPIRGCNNIGRVGDIAVHVSSCIERDIICPFQPIGCDEKVSVHQIECHLAEETAQHTDLLMETLVEIKNDISKLGKNNETLQDIQKLTLCRLEKIALEQANLNGKIQSFQLEASEIIRERNELKQEQVRAFKRIIQLEESLAVAQDMIQKGFEYIWKIPEMTVKRAAAKSGKLAGLYSDKFLSHRNGYKLCLEMYPNGVGSGSNSHVSISFNILPGEYDDILLWPFQKKVRVSVIDPRTFKDVQIREYNFKNIKDAYKCNFARPLNSSKRGLGWDMFLLWDDLLNEGSPLVDNCLYIRCYVTD